jgi:hypothetical protein
MNENGKLKSFRLVYKAFSIFHSQDYFHVKCTLLLVFLPDLHELDQCVDGFLHILYTYIFLA